MPRPSARQKTPAGPVTLSNETRAEMTRLAASAPGLENERMLALMSATAAIHQASELGLVVSGAGNGMVVTAQSPGAGSRAVRGDAVRLTLSGGEGLAGANGTTPVKPVPVGPISIQLP